MTKDSNKTLENIVTCLKSTVQQEPQINKQAFKLDNRPEPEEMVFSASRGEKSQTNESLDEMSHSSNISNIFESILKDYSQVNTSNNNQREGLADFEDIPHKVSIAPPRVPGPSSDQNNLFHRGGNINLNESQFTESLIANLVNAFRIDQGNDQSLRLEGCKSLDLKSMLKDDYIPK